MPHSSSVLPVPSVNKLPRIRCGGIDWIVDLRLQEIRRADNPHVRIHFNDLPDDAVDKVADLMWRKGVEA